MAKREGFLSSLERSKTHKMKNSYIYFHNLTWKEDCLEPVSIEKGIIVYNVKRVDGSFISKCLGCPAYEFETENGEKFGCNYSWAFAENTPENKEKIRRYEEHRVELEKAMKKNKMLFEEIDFIKE